MLHQIRGLAKTVIDSLIKKAGNIERQSLYYHISFLQADKGSTIGGGARLNEKVGWPAITELFSYADEAARVGTLLTLATLANSPGIFPFSFLQISNGFRTDSVFLQKMLTKL